MTIDSHKNRLLIHIAPHFKFSMLFVLFYIFLGSQYALLAGNKPIKNLGGRLQTIADKLAKKNDFVDQSKVEHMLAEIKVTIKKIDIYNSDPKNRKKSTEQVQADNEYKKLYNEFEKIKAAFGNLEKRKGKKAEPVKSSTPPQKVPEEKPVNKVTPKPTEVVKQENSKTADKGTVAPSPAVKGVQTQSNYETIMITRDEINEIVKQQVDDALGENKPKETTKTNPWLMGLLIIFGLGTALIAVVWVVLKGKGIDLFASIPFLKASAGSLTSPHAVISGQYDKELQKVIAQLENTLQENSVQIKELSLTVKELKGKEVQAEKKISTLEQKLTGIKQSAEESADYIDFLKRKIEGKRASMKEENSTNYGQNSIDVRPNVNGDLNAFYNSANTREYQQEFRNRMIVCSMANSREILEEHQDLTPVFVEDTQGSFLISEEKNYVFVNFNIPSARHSLVEIAFAISGTPGEGAQVSRYPAKVRKTIFGWELVERGHVDFTVS